MQIKSISTKIALYAFVFVCFSCQNKAENQSELAPIKYLALGDSYTIGQSVEKNKSWPIQLAEKLSDDGFSIEKTDIIAKTGWETTDLLKALADSTFEDYNLVSLLIGVNNQYANQPFGTYTTEFDLLLRKAIELAGTDRVFVVSIPDYGVTPFGKSKEKKIALELDAYNDYASTKCQTLNVPFINITKLSRRLGDTNNALATDSLHPSESQYRAWVEKILPTVLEILKE
jgi:lysophospholipase L1-like esterase